MAVSTRAVRVAAISAEPLDIDAHLRAVDDAHMGAITTFVGRVRDHDPDAATAVVALEYSAHPDAEETLARLASEAIGSTGALVAVSHRVGTLAIGDVALVASVSTAHRAAAFAACARLVDEAKARLPIWKRQVFTDGSEEWVNCP